MFSACAGVKRSKVTFVLKPAARCRVPHRMLPTANKVRASPRAARVCEFYSNEFIKSASKLLGEPSDTSLALTFLVVYRMRGIVGGSNIL